MEAAYSNGKQDVYHLMWFDLVPRFKTAAHSRHFIVGPDHPPLENGVRIESLIKPTSPITHVRVTMYPDGGISRCRVWGHYFDKRSSKLH